MPTGYDPSRSEAHEIQVFRESAHSMRASVADGDGGE